MRNPHGGYYDETKINRCEPTKPPPVMTERHVKTIEGWATYMEMLNALTDDKHSLDDALALTREVATNISSLVSGKVVVVNPKTHAIIPKRELESSAVAIARLADGKREDSAVFSRLYDLFTRWLTRPSGEHDDE
jgi:hypothetical protein